MQALTLAALTVLVVAMVVVVVVVVVVVAAAAAAAAATAAAAAVAVPVRLMVMRAASDHSPDRSFNTLPVFLRKLTQSSAMGHRQPAALGHRAERGEVIFLRLRSSVSFYFIQHCIQRLVCAPST